MLKSQVNGENEPVRSTSFALDLDAIRTRARKHIERGAVTEGYAAQRGTILKLLNDSLASEIVCVLRYRRHYFMAGTIGGIPGSTVSKEFLQHANQEQAHADAIAERIVQLGGEPEFDPKVVAVRSHTQYVPGATLVEMLQEDLVAERIAIDTYTQIIRYIGESDPTTRRLFEGILENEEEHAEDIADFLRRIG